MDVSCGFRPLYSKVDNCCRKIAGAEGGKAVCRKWAMGLESDFRNLEIPALVSQSLQAQTWHVRALCSGQRLQNRKSHWHLRGRVKAAPGKRFEGDTNI